MKIIYLDEWCWIDILNVLLGKDCNKNTLEFIKIAKDNISKGIWIFPLTLWHLEETKNTGNDNRRTMLAKIQQEFSNNWYMSSFHHIREKELQYVVNGKKLKQSDVIQHDISGMFGISRREMIREVLNEEDIKDSESEFYEELLYKLFPTSFTSFSSLAVQHASLEFLKEEQIKHLKYLKELDMKQKLTKYEILLINLKNYFSLNQQKLILENLLPQIITFDKKESRKFIIEYFKNIPSFYTGSMLLYEHIRSKQNANSFHKNDFLDIVHLSVAIPYCDIVITESHWKRQTDKQCLGQIYNTDFLDNINDLLE